MTLPPRPWTPLLPPLLPLALLAALAGLALPAAAADRPYLFTNSAVAEEDEEQVWSVENWYRQTSLQRSLTVAPEYAFDPVDSLQVEFRRALDRSEGDGHEIEIEYKHLFNRFARDGWGLGLVAAIDLDRREGGVWRRGAVSLSVPFSVQFGAGGPLLHLNAGISKPTDAKRVWTGVIAAEHEVWRRTTLFGEWAHDAEGRLLHGGVRYWVKRERLAIDLAWQRVDNDAGRGSGVVLGIAWYDL